MSPIISVCICSTTAWLLRLLWSGCVAVCALHAAQYTQYVLHPSQTHYFVLFAVEMLATTVTIKLCAVSIYICATGMQTCNSVIGYRTANCYADVAT